ncbi:MAG: aminoacyl-tRNA deacylase [Candidatus Competibacteraceae bacterium]|nr:aminoacyl-tRNA deacylase [Candidatus Competibacteraceae bacterium]
MSRDKPPVTPAVRVLRAQRVEFSDHFYSYHPKGGAELGAQELGVHPHQVIKTLIMEDEAGNPMIVLMYGDQKVSTKALARQLGVKLVRPCEPKVADKHSGYRVGGTSPFGTRRRMPVYMEAGILELPRVYINGGRRGYLLELDPREIQRVLEPTLVEGMVSPS